MIKIVINVAKRTPHGSFQGALSSLSATALASVVIKDIVKNTDLPIEQVIMGCVLQAGLGQAPARQAALKANLPVSVNCSTVSKVCGSGMLALAQAFDQIKLGYVNVVIAGGMESMSNAPYLLTKARSGYRMGHGECTDHMFKDGLEDAYQVPSAMGFLAEKIASEYKFARQEQDEFAFQTYNAAQKAVNDGAFQNEITNTTIQNKKEVIKIDKDEPISKVKPEKFADLRPAFVDDGTITVATSSSIADGACALLLTKESISTPLAYMSGYSVYGVEPARFTTAPVGAMQKLLKQLDWNIQDVDVFEINEAFAMVPMVAMRELKISREKININGGSCVLGHPLGTSGARIVVTLAHAMARNNYKKGIASICIGSGEAMAIALER